MVTRRAGWKPDVVREASGGAAPPRYRAGVPMPRRFDRLTTYVGAAQRLPGLLPVLDQGATERCVPFAFAEVLWGRLRELGAPPVLADIQAAYVLAQLMEHRRLGTRLPLADDGLHPRDLLDATELWGVRACSGPGDARLAPARALDPVWADEVQDAARHTVTGWRRIPDGRDPEGVVLETKRYLMAGFPGMAGGAFDASFTDYQGGVYARTTARPTVMRHMTSIWGWDDDARAFIALNHWTEDWGDRGWFLVDYATYGSRHFSDRYHLDAAPKF